MFHVNKNIKQTYKNGFHFTVVCCTNKCIINERYIPEHQNKLNVGHRNIDKPLIKNLEI